MASSTGEKGTSIDCLDMNAWLTQNRLTKLKQYFEENEVILSDLLKYQEGDMNVVINDVNITAGVYAKRFKDSVRELQHIHNKTCPPSQSNLNKVYRIVTSMKENQCMLLLERKLNEIDVALENNINITSKLMERTKRIETDINLAFDLYKNKLMERQKLMINKLNEETNKQLNTLQTQKRNFCKYKVSIQTAQKAQNSLVLDPQFDRAKRQSKIEEMTNNVTNSSINENDMKTVIHPLIFTADTYAMYQCIASIGALNIYPGPPALNDLNIVDVKVDDVKVDDVDVDDDDDDNIESYNWKDIDWSGGKNSCGGNGNGNGNCNNNEGNTTFTFQRTDGNLSNEAYHFNNKKKKPIFNASW